MPDARSEAQKQADRIAVGVLIPAYNDQIGLDATLDVLSSELTPCIIYVVDDGSSPRMIVPASVGPHPVHLTTQPSNLGIEYALNAGIERIRAAGHNYIARLDCGDTPMEGRLARQVAYLDAHADVGIVGTWARCVDDDGKYLFTLRLPADHDEMVRKQRYVPAMLHPTVMIRTSVLDIVGVYSDDFRTAEDYDLFVRISRAARIANIPETLTEYIVSQTGTTAAKRHRNLVSRLGVQRRYFEVGQVHAYLGIARTLLFMAIPFSWLTAAKRRLWR